MTDSLKFLKLHPAAKLPTRGSKYAAGLDLYSVEDTIIPAGERVLVRTGLSVAIPSGYYGRVAPRSGLAAEYGVDVLAGVIDSDYRGEIVCVLINHGREIVHLKAGRRVAQLLLESIITPQAEWADKLDETDRGSGGFGSSEESKRL
jgi:dUTP pyrophosphatase